jgi:hypothetical protein
LIVAFDCLLPELAYVTGTFLAKANVDQKVTIACIWLKIRRHFVRRPLFDVWLKIRWAIPTSECAGALGFIVMRGAKRDNSFNL